MEKVIVMHAEFCGAEKINKEKIIKKIMQDFNLDSRCLIKGLEVLSLPDAYKNKTVQL